MQSKLMAAAALATLSLTVGASAWAAPDANILAAVADKGRPEADTSRDALRKPAEMLEFAGVKPGQTVVDMLPGGGYFTRIFSKAVGPKGVVYAVATPPRTPIDPAKLPAPESISADPAYANTKSLRVAFTAFAIPTKADLVWTSQNYHDLKNNKDLDTVALNKAVFDALKPGGTYIVLDHAADAEPADATSSLHRINPETVKKEVTAAGFKFAGESTVLRNPADDHKKKVFEAGEHDHTDQFIYKFTKPK